MSVRLKIENSREGLVATISQRDDEGKVIGRPSVSLVASKEEAKQQAKTLARSLGLKLYGIVDKTGATDEPRPLARPWRWQFRLSGRSRSHIRQRFRNDQSGTCPAGAAIMAFRESSDGFFWNQGFERRSVGTPVKPTVVGPLGPTGRGLQRGRARNA